MIYAKIHAYQKDGATVETITAKSTPEDGFQEFDVPSVKSLKIVAGQIVVCDTSAEDLAVAKSEKASEIRREYDSEMNALTSQYPASEINSWPKQESEARAYLADNAIPTPILTAIATASGTTVDLLAARVMVKAEAYSQFAGTLIGKRQALEAQVTDALTAADVEAISWA